MREEITGYLDPATAGALAGVLGSSVSGLGEGDVLPPLWHWVYLLPRPATDRLGADGHPVDGTPHPPAPGMRRMFAGGRVVQAAPLRLGVHATRHIEVVDSYTRKGSTGRLQFLSVRHRIVQRDVLTVEEHQTIVYRKAATPVVAPDSRSASAPVDCGGSSHHREVAVSPTKLFQFSALTYNAHRIHYDTPYTVQVEGYAGLVVHGPLQALLMSDLACAVAGPWTDFTFRLVSPHIASTRLGVHAHLEGTDVRACLTDAAGTTTAVAKASR